MPSEYSIANVAAVIQWWLSYTLALDREYVLSESSIKHPMTEYLERSESVLRNSIRLERSHPLLQRRRIDLTFSLVGTESQPTESAFEFKYIKDGSTLDLSEKKRVFNDLMRLHLFAHTGGAAFFLICGKLHEFINSFQEDKSQSRPVNEQSIIQPQENQPKTKSIQAQGFYSRWFSFDSSQRDMSIDLTDLTPQYREVYDDFVSEYGEAYFKATGLTLSLPCTLRTELLFLPSNEIDIQAPPQARVGIWRVHG